MTDAFAIAFPGSVPDELPAPLRGARRVAPQRVEELAGRFLDAPGPDPWLAPDPTGDGFYVLCRAEGTDGLADLFGTTTGSEPGGRGLADTILDAATLPLRLTGAALEAVRHPDQAVMGALLGAAASVLWSRPETPYDAAAEGRLHVGWAHVQLADLAPLTEGPGASVDDVLGSAVTRALRADLERQGYEGDGNEAPRLAGLVLDEAQNAPGDLRLGGRRARDVLPLPDPDENVALGLLAVRDDGGVTIGIAADPDVLPDPGVLAQELDAAIEELRAAAAGPATPPEPLPDAPAPAPEPPAAPLPGEVEAPVETPSELVAEVADAGAEEGAGAQVRVDEPWPGYGEMTGPEIVERMSRATDEELAVVALYEPMHRDRPTVREAAERALSRR